MKKILIVLSVLMCIMMAGCQNKVELSGEYLAVADMYSGVYLSIEEDDSGINVELSDGETTVGHSAKYDEEKSLLSIGENEEINYYVDGGYLLQKLEGTVPDKDTFEKQYVSGKYFSIYFYDSGNCNANVSGSEYSGTYKRSDGKIVATFPDFTYNFRVIDDELYAEVFVKKSNGNLLDSEKTSNTDINNKTINKYETEELVTKTVGDVQYKIPKSWENSVKISGINTYYYDNELMVMIQKQEVDYRTFDDNFDKISMEDTRDSILSGIIESAKSYEEISTTTEKINGVTAFRFIGNAVLDNNQKYFMDNTMFAYNKNLYTFGIEVENGRNIKYDVELSYLLDSITFLENKNESEKTIDEMKFYHDDNNFVNILLNENNGKYTIMCFGTYDNNLNAIFDFMNISRSVFDGYDVNILSTVNENDTFTFVSYDKQVLINTFPDSDEIDFSNFENISSTNDFEIEYKELLNRNGLSYGKTIDE